MDHLGLTGSSPDTFRRHLKMHYFKRALNPLNAFLLAPQVRLLLTIGSVYKSYLFIYLFIYLYSECTYHLVFGS